jgi:3',5'-cyclic AMP phosphodiesterase CpdA
MDRRKFLTVSGVSLGAGALYTMGPLLAANAEGAELARQLGRQNGERPTPFTVFQLSDTHVGWDGALGTKAFERAVEVVNGLAPGPDLVLFTGDLTHDTEAPGEHSARMKRFQEIAGRLKVPKVYHVPGEHDAGLDAGELYRSVFGPTFYSFDHKGFHFVALDNVSRAKPEVGAEQRAWLAKDLARFPQTAPIVVFTHRPLFDLRPDWEWFTSDGDAVMAVLARFENVTVLYGHIHREDARTTSRVRHYAARSLAWAFPDPTQVADKKPVKFDPEHPYRGLGLRVLHASPGKDPAPLSLGLEEIELTMRETSGTEGFQQLLKPSTL